MSHKWDKKCAMCGSDGIEVAPPGKTFGKIIVADMGCRKCGTVWTSGWLYERKRNRKEIKDRYKQYLTTKGKVTK
jgi:hypothetical protein